MHLVRPAVVALALALPSLSAAVMVHDVVIYGGTSAAITAAIQAKSMGKSVIVVSPDIHLGGLTSGGLGFTDSGDKSVIGGLSREFYHRVWQHYQRPEAWTWQKRSEFGNRGQGTRAIDDETETMWVFEPGVAEGIFEAWVKEHGLQIVRDEWLDRESGVVVRDGRIVSISTLSGATYRGRMFIDATYEGDLMAAAGVDYRVGREANSEYGEQHNGVQTGVLHHNHHFGTVPNPVDPYVVPGDPKSGVLPRISTEPPGTFGAADHRVQAYCFRTCYTNDPDNRVPWPKPEGYDVSQYEVLVRIFDAGWRGFFGKFDRVPNDKTDTNNHGPFSYDNIGYNYDYPEASYERRREIVAEHRTYQQGLIWFVANDPRIPKDVQEEFNTWGLARDEFTDNGHWPHQLYIREARRMVGLHVMTENQIRLFEPTPDPVGMGSYTIDSHNVQRYITPEGFVQNEGDIGVHLKGPYTIAYGSLVPKRGQAGNLLVPVACSATHIAYGSIRMEPVFMILGQSAATAAVIALDTKIDVQDVLYADLRARLLADGQILEKSAAPVVAALDAKNSTPDDASRPRVIVSSDIGGSDPDDFQSLVHYLVYADRFDTEGLVSSPPNAGRAADILKTLDAYASDYGALRRASDRYPTPEALRAVVAQGATDPQAGEKPADELNDGARLIIERARAGDPRPLYVLVWGSITDVALAVHHAPDIKGKLRIYSIGSWNTRLDERARDYLFAQHPDLWWIENDTTFRGMYIGGPQAGDLGNESFVAAHVRDRAELGALFARMKGDIKMGDTPSVLYLLNGVADDPEASGWGGRFVRPFPNERPHYWHDDPNPAYAEGDKAGAKTVNRWREDYLRDWARRMARLPFTGG
ncbi:MAG TPA: FAD-dependent oxidoreductase [Opitutaceae bacterium]|nr:FAD-dependent oxidoreductase [Opitutaceae bacterium]